MTDLIYSSRVGDTDAYTNLQKLYTQLAKMTLQRVQKTEMDDDGQSPTKPIPNQFYDWSLEEYTFEPLHKVLDWNNANVYFVLAMVFGLVDSLGKNITLRN